MARPGKTPDNLESLINETAKVYNWPAVQLEYVKKGLREYPWTEKKTELVEKTIRENQWTATEISEIEKAYRTQKLTVGFFLLNPNPKLKKFDAVIFKQEFLTDTGPNVTFLIPDTTEPMTIGVGYYLKANLCSIM